MPFVSLAVAVMVATSPAREWVTETAGGVSSLTVIVQEAVLKLPTPSVALSVKVGACSTVGVPLTKPLEAVSARPVGRLPVFE